MTAQSISFLVLLFPPAILYNLSKSKSEAMEAYIRDSLAAGIIRCSSSPLGAGSFFVTKKDSSLRPCMDFRGLNNISIKNKLPLPLIDSAFTPRQGATVFSKLDLCNAYYLARIKEGDKWKQHLTPILANLNIWSCQMPQQFFKP